jgi:hypothetical protein
VAIAAAKQSVAQKEARLATAQHDLASATRRINQLTRQSGTRGLNSANSIKLRQLTQE